MQPILIILLALAAAGYFITNFFCTRKKRLRQIKNSFGAVPDNTYKLACVQHFGKRCRLYSPRRTMWTTLPGMI